MEIQEVLISLTSAASQMNEIKIKKVRGELSQEEAKAACAKVLCKMLKEKIIEQAVAEWSPKQKEPTLDDIIGE